MEEEETIDPLLVWAITHLSDGHDLRAATLRALEDARVKLGAQEFDAYVQVSGGLARCVESLELMLTLVGPRTLVALSRRKESADDESESTPLDLFEFAVSDTTGQAAGDLDVGVKLLSALIHSTTLP